MLSALYPAKDHVDRVSKYEDYQNELNFDGIEFPVSAKDYPKFEKLNRIKSNPFAQDGIVAVLYNGKITD